MKIANRWKSVVKKLGIGCVVCLLLGFGILLYAQEQTKSKFIGVTSEVDTLKVKETNPTQMKAMPEAKEQSQPQRNRTWGRQNRGGGVDFGENAAFYKTIIDHNLFRPLGWTPPNNEPSYSLASTAIDSNGAGVISQATLLERRSNRYHFVTIGSKLDDMTVKDIQAKQVILDKAGEEVTLKIPGLQLLTVNRERRGDRGGERGEGGSERASNNNAGQNRVNVVRSQMGQNERAAAEQRTRQRMMERMRNASDAERREMIEQFRRRAGSRRGRGRDR